MVSKPRKRKPKQATEIISRPVESLTFYSRNARTHSSDQVAQLKRSIEQFGFNNPILIDKAGTLIAGHGRLQAAIELGMKEVPTIELAHLSDDEKRAYILADNQLAMNAGWDEELLREELADLQFECDFDLDVIGFSEDELTKMLDVSPSSPSESEPTKTSDSGLVDKMTILEAGPKKRIHVNQHNIRANDKLKKDQAHAPVITIKTSDKNWKCFGCEVKGDVQLIYSPHKPLPCGAKVWIETEGKVLMSDASVMEPGEVDEG